MNPVISAQAHQLNHYLQSHDATKAHLFLEKSHLPYDVQDLILAALSSLPRLNDALVEEVLENYSSVSSFDERLLH